MMLALRAAVVVAGLALVFLGVRRHEGHDACNAARSDAFSIVQKQAPAGGAPAVAQRIKADCRDVGVLAEGAVALLRVNQVAAARTLATTAVQRAPDGRNGWIALSQVRRKAGDTAGADAALDRAHQLDPVGVRRG
jgi:cytochrome c-type biogenesis protein CcmH/NrfG